MNSKNINKINKYKYVDNNESIEDITNPQIENETNDNVDQNNNANNNINDKNDNQISHNDNTLLNKLNILNKGKLNIEKDQFQDIANIESEKISIGNEIPNSESFHNQNNDQLIKSSISIKSILSDKSPRGSLLRIPKILKSSTIYPESQANFVENASLQEEAKESSILDSTAMEENEMQLPKNLLDENITIFVLPKKSEADNLKRDSVLYSDDIITPNFEDENLSQHLESTDNFEPNLGFESKSPRFPVSVPLSDTPLTQESTLSPDSISSSKPFITSTESEKNQDEDSQISSVTPSTPAPDVEETNKSSKDQNPPSSNDSKPSTVSNVKETESKEKKSTLKSILTKLLNIILFPFRYILFSYYITPGSLTRSIIDLIACIILLYNLFTVSYRASFEYDSHISFKIIDIFFDCIYTLIMISNLFEAHNRLHNHKIIKNRRYAALKYVKFRFWLDIVTFFPYDWILLKPKWRLNRLIGLFQFVSYYSRLEVKFANSFPGSIKIIKLAILLVIMLHLGSCLIYSSMNIEANGRRFGSFVLLEVAESVAQIRTLLTIKTPFIGYSSDNFKHYITSFYIVTSLTVGSQNALPQDMIQVLVCILMVVFGAGFIATIISTATAVVSDLNKTESQFQDKISTLKDYMRFRKVSKNIRKDVIKYYNNLYRSGSLVDRREVIGDLLDANIERQIAKSLHIDLVEKVPLFKAVNNEFFIDDICLELEYIFLLKGYYIIRKGEVGKEMYFIKNGVVEVVGDNGEVFAQLKEGSFFGQVALTSSDSIRTANIRAAENCELFSLTKQAFDNVCSIYPDALRIIQENSQQQMAKK